MSARGEPDDPARVGRVKVDDRGHPRVTASPTSLLEEPADAARPGLVDADRRRRGGLPERLDSGGHQDAVHRPPCHAVVCCDFAHRPVRRRHRRTDLAPQPRSQPGPGPDLLADLGERTTRTQLLGAHGAALQTHSRSGTLPCGRSFNRQTGRSFTRDDMTPHEGQPPSTATLSTRTRRPPSGSSVTFRTRNPGSANSNVVRSIMARGSLQPGSTAEVFVGSECVADPVFAVRA